MPAFKFMNLPIFSSGMFASTSSPVERILDLVALEPLPRLYIQAKRKLNEGIHLFLTLIGSKSYVVPLYVTSKETLLY
jgi:hypothetical protein